MGLFELFKKQANNQNKEEQFDSNSIDSAESVVVEDIDIDIEASKNEPYLHTVKLLYEDLPIIDENLIINDLKVKYPNIKVKEADNMLLFTFLKGDKNENYSDFECCLMTSTDYAIHPLPIEAFKQNWHWKEGGSIARNCKYEILLTEKTLTQIHYKQRTEIFIDFVSACIKTTQPLVVYSKNAEKLLDPNDVLSCHTSIDPDFLHPLTNIRMFKVADSIEEEIIMDTIGLSAFGLPDFEIIFCNKNPSKIAELLLRYCYFIYDIGDNILNGEYVEALDPEEKWRCEKRISILQPNRVVLHVIVS